jgi:hypothetical protein
MSRAAHRATRRSITWPGTAMSCCRAPMATSSAVSPPGTAPNSTACAPPPANPYDMFAMTAAHKTLPLPCYARVTNLSNGRSVVVRINDRGPVRRQSHHRSVLYRRIQARHDSQRHRLRPGRGSDSPLPPTLTAELPVTRRPRSRQHRRQQCAACERAPMTAPRQPRLPRLRPATPAGTGTSRCERCASALPARRCRRSSGQLLHSGRRLRTAGKRQCARCENCAPRASRTYSRLRPTRVSRCSACAWVRSPACSSSMPLIER